MHGMCASVHSWGLTFDPAALSMAGAAQHALTCYVKSYVCDANLLTPLAQGVVEHGPLVLAKGPHKNQRKVPHLHRISKEVKQL